MIDKFIVGAFYTRQQIHDAVGGDLESYLPTANKKVVAGCFTLGLNPQLPYIILVGDAPIVIKNAKILSEQDEPIPVFNKIAVNKWEFLDYFRAVKYIDEMSEIQPYADAAGRNNVVGLIELKKID